MKYTYESITQQIKTPLQMENEAKKATGFANISRLAMM
jgi:hypothetical protein